MQTIHDFIKKHPRLVFSVELIDQRPDQDPSDTWHNPKNPKDRPFNYRVSLKNGHEEYTTYYSKGVGHGKRTQKAAKSYEAYYQRARRADHIACKPTLAEILDSLALDASDIANGYEFEEWAENLGYDTDSRQAERIYNACKDVFLGLVRLLGLEGVNDLINNTERE